jgi:hypothetical protein
VRERQLDDLADLRHRPERRRHPRQRGDGERLAAPGERREQRLGMTASPIHCGATTRDLALVILALVILSEAKDLAVDAILRWRSG